MKQLVSVFRIMQSISTPGIKLMLTCSFFSVVGCNLQMQSTSLRFQCQVPGRWTHVASHQ